MARSPPLFTWKAVQRWAVGSRAPRLCKLFVRARNPAKLRIARFLGRHRAIRPPDTARKGEAIPRPRSALAACCAANCHSEASDSCRGALAMEASRSGYERVSTGVKTTMVELVMKSHSSVQRSSCSFFPPRSDSPTCSSKPTASPAPAFSSKIKGTCTRILSAAQHKSPGINELIVGNQFLMHVTAAPVAAGPTVKLKPSAGLVNGLQKPRDAGLKHRIIFFQ